MKRKVKSEEDVKTVSLPRHARTAAVRADTFDEDDNGVDIIFTTGADVLRNDWFDGEYIERLLTGDDNVRLDRLNAGAAFLDTHNAYELGAMIGSVVPGSARMENGQGLCRVQLSRSERAADTVTDIRDGIIRNISVGYNVYAFTRTESSDGTPPIMVATDWEPCEVSAVPVPADPGAQVRAATRSASGVEVHQCTITRAEGSKQEATMADEPKPAPGTTIPTKDAPKDPPKVLTVEEQAQKEKDDAAKKAGIEPGDVTLVDKGKVIHKDANDITDPGDANPVKTVEAEVRKALAAERVRVNTITDLAAKAGLRDFGAEHAREGTDLTKFRNLLMDKMFEQRANDGGPDGAALAPVTSLAEKSAISEREAGAAAARAALGKK